MKEDRSVNRFVNIIILLSLEMFSLILTMNYSVFIIYDGYIGENYYLQPKHILIVLIISLPIYSYLIYKKNIYKKITENISKPLILVSVIITVVICRQLIMDIYKNETKICNYIVLILGQNYMEKYGQIFLKFGTYFCVFIAAFAIFLIYFYLIKIVVMFWKPILSSLQDYEKKYIRISFLISLLLIIAFFSSVRGQWNSLDLIYQTDCSFIYEHYFPVYSFGYDYDWDIGNGGIRHPMTTMFTYPIYILALVIKKFLFLFPEPLAISYAIINAIIIVLIGILISRLTKNKYALFIYMVSSPALFYIVFIEKYQLITLLLVMYIYSIVNNHEKNEQRVLLIAATGTMVISAFLGFFYGKSKNIKKRIIEYIEIGCSFILALILSGRINYILNFIYLKNQNYIMFTNQNQTNLGVLERVVKRVFEDIFCSITNLAASCFIPISHTNYGTYIYWDELVSKVNGVGRIICILSIITIIIYRKNKLIQVCALWFVLCIIQMVAFNAGASALFNLYYVVMFIILLSFCVESAIKNEKIKKNIYCSIFLILCCLNTEHMVEIFKFLLEKTPL